MAWHHSCDCRVKHCADGSMCGDGPEADEKHKPLKHFSIQEMEEEIARRKKEERDSKIAKLRKEYAILNKSLAEDTARINQVSTELDDLMRQC